MTHLPTIQSREGALSYAPFDLEIEIAEMKFRSEGFVSLDDRSVRMKVWGTNPEGNPDLWVFFERFSNPRFATGWKILPNDGNGPEAGLLGGGGRSAATRASKGSFKMCPAGRRVRLALFDVKKLLQSSDCEEEGRIHFSFDSRVEVTEDIAATPRVCQDVLMRSVEPVIVYASDAVREAEED